jgi:alpha-tubulin suppressor-like RCC1 family protein
VAIALGCAFFGSLRGQPGSVRADTPPPVLDIWTFGRNRVGQLGSVPPNTTIPSPMHEARHWVAVSAGGEHTLALTDEGEVYAWGSNVDGQLGDGTTTDSILPVRVAGLTGITLISAGGSYGLAYRASDGALFGWGSNARGEIGQDVSVTGSASPLPIAGVGKVTALAAGNAFSLALATDGTVFAWGDNLLGQLGATGVDERSTPDVVPLAGPAIAIAAGSGHGIAVTAGDGQAWTWGWNVFGQLGTGAQGAPGAAFPVPARAVGVTGVDQVSAGAFHSFARTLDGHVWAWGYNTEGQVGNGAHTPANTGVLTPVLLEGIDSVVSVDAGGIHSVALRANGEVWTWGNDQFGACGVNGRVDQRVPTRIFGDRHATSVSAGGYHSVILSAPRPAMKLRQLGDPTVTKTPELPLIREVTAPAGSGPSDVSDLALGSRHALAIDGQHRLWSWGDDSNGQLGTDDGAHDAPELVDVPLDGTGGFVRVAARGNQSFALRSDGRVYAWGDNTYGALGLGNTPTQRVPARIIGLGKIVDIAAGERHGLALAQDATIWSWGQNRHGELGIPPSSALTRNPAQVSGMYGVIAIAAGGFHSASIDVNGTLLLWGDGFRGQLGNGSNIGNSSGKASSLPADVVMASLGRLHSLAIRSGGSLWSFGENAACQLGTGTIPGIWDPQATKVPGPIQLVAAGSDHGLALGYDGAVYGWGDDASGALGVPGPSVSHSECAPVTAELPPAVLLAGGNGFSIAAVGPTEDQAL